MSELVPPREAKTLLEENVVLHLGFGVRIELESMLAGGGLDGFRLLMETVYRSLLICEMGILLRHYVEVEMKSMLIIVHIHKSN